MRNGVRFRGGGRAPVPSLPVDDPLTSDKKGIYFSYTRMAIPYMFLILVVAKPICSRLCVSWES
jgi:hypothetical protein